MIIHLLVIFLTITYSFNVLIVSTSLQLRSFRLMWDRLLWTHRMSLSGSWSNEIPTQHPSVCQVTTGSPGPGLRGSLSLSGGGFSGVWPTGAMLSPVHHRVVPPVYLAPLRPDTQYTWVWKRTVWLTLDCRWTSSLITVNFDTMMLIKTRTPCSSTLKEPERMTSVSLTHTIFYLSFESLISPFVSIYLLWDTPTERTHTQRRTAPSRWDRCAV